MEKNGTAGTHCWTWTLNNLLRLEQQERMTRRKDLQKSEDAEFVTVSFSKTEPIFSIKVDKAQ